jgi:hypothetical protein
MSGNVVSRGANGKSQSSRGKAMLLALGKGLPDQVLPQEKVVENYLHDSSCDDPATRAKLERLCKLSCVHRSCYFFKTIIFVLRT